MAQALFSLLFLLCLLVHHGDRLKFLLKLEVLMPLAVMGGARCYAEVVVWHVVAFFTAGMANIFEAVNPKCSWATHLPRWRPHLADCVRGALAFACTGGLYGGLPHRLGLRGGV